jgi:hypothetical protein
MAKLDPQVLAHLEWIGYVQPTGLVVSAPAMVRAGAILDRSDAEGQRLLRECVEERQFGVGEDPESWLPDFKTFARTVLDWSFSPKGYAGIVNSPIPDELQVTLTDYGETLQPDFAVRDLSAKDEEPGWQLLVRVLEPGQPLDEVIRGPGGLEVSHHSRMERLLRRTGVKAGLLFNGQTIRLVSAPRGESSGWMDFCVHDMVQTAGRPICSALRLLLREFRLLSVSSEKRLAALLENSRKYQNEVSERLAEQVLHALYELLRGFQAAHDASGKELLREVLAEHPDQVYRALLTVLLRLVFLLYAEERDMLPKEEAFLRYYSVAGLFERLREDASLHPDTMDQRYGAWAQLLVLFRLVYDGADSGDMHLPRRHGVLFDPDRFRFLEGHVGDGVRQVDKRIEPPLVPDGTIHRALAKLLVLDGERISYRALDVEQIGSVYETMMGFRLETASGTSVAIKAQKKQGAPTTVDMEALLAEPGAKRDKWLQGRIDRKLTAKIGKAVKEAERQEDLHAALLPVIDLDAAPDLVPAGAMVLQPSDERRRSGSHYTPRELTEPIVRSALKPILEALRGEGGASPRPEQILDLKVGDPAMGSGAFLVEACRQLGDALVEAWHAKGETPRLPADEDEVTFARRLVAQKCLYGVDRNPVAVDLAKVSLWLATLAKDHALTFLDHALRHGDSLVGLTLRQVEVFNWDTSVTWESPFRTRMRNHLTRVSELRQRIRHADETVADWELRGTWDEIEVELGTVRLLGDLLVGAFFGGQTIKDRARNRSDLVTAVTRAEGCGYESLERLTDPSLAAFHWEIEFPEVFSIDNPGFDSLFGNPPFLGGARIWPSLGPVYPDWIRFLHPNSKGKAVDLVAHFFRRAFGYVRDGGTLGFVATNSIAQGDTREAGLKQICEGGGHIFEARRRIRWPGSASVIVSVVFVAKGVTPRSCILDGKTVPGLNSFLVPSTVEFDPIPLQANRGGCFQGACVLGMGFTFDDTDATGLASSLAEMNEIVERNRNNKQRIRPYIGGQEINSHPKSKHHRYVIDFSGMSLPEAQQWPDLLSIVEERVKPSRDEMGGYSVADRRREYWWQFGTQTPALDSAKEDLKRVLAIARISNTFAPTFLPARTVCNEKTLVFPFDTFAAFASIQSRVHETWARFFGGSLGDTFQYTPADCFSSFPFPRGWLTDADLETAGECYFLYRAELMESGEQGLTTVYNRFHESQESDTGIEKLRRLHAAVDRSVLEAYGWGDLPTDCEFLLEYELDETTLANKRKPYRLRWPDEIRDEVLARLLKLNAERAGEEARSGKTTSNKKPRKKRAAFSRDEGTGDLFS